MNRPPKQGGGQRGGGDLGRGGGDWGMTEKSNTSVSAIIRSLKKSSCVQNNQKAPKSVCRIDEMLEE